MLPFMNPTNKKSKKYVVAFKGLNYGEGYEDGEFSETKNISTEEYPCLTQSRGRVKETFDGKIDESQKITPRNLTGTNAGLFYIDDSALWCNGENTGLEVPYQSKGYRLACIGNYIVIFPCKLYYNFVTKEHGSMEIEDVYKATVTPNTIDLVSEEDYPSEFAFSKGDTVEIVGIPGYPDKDKPKIATIREWEPKKLTFDANAFTANSTAAEITIKRTVPDLEYICESNYRLWGVKGNTIYGSKYSDPMNFQSFDGSSGDSYAIEVGSDGKFTGCIPYTSHICFFKENMLHKLYGSKPSNFQLVNSKVYGVQEGSERSMTVINEVLYYKGVNGVYAYTGGVPELVSSKFGTEVFSDAVAANDGRRYYISLRAKGSSTRGGLYVYDTSTRMWVRESKDEIVEELVFYNGHIYFAYSAADAFFDKSLAGLWKISQTADRSNIEWSVTFCPFNEVMNERKGYSKFHMRLDLSEGASLVVKVKRNNDTQWHEVYSVPKNERPQTITVPILPARCDSVEIRLSGKGVCKLRTFIREFYVGSDV